MPLWSLFRRVKDVGHPDEEMLSVFRDHGVVAKSSRENLNQTAENRNIYQLVHPGWLVVNRMKAWQGSVGISPLRGIVSGHYVCFQPRHQENPNYLNWLLRSPVYAHEFRRLSRGVRPSQQEIDNEQLRLLPIALPPINRQVAIADYLDRETARIDELIAEQEALIDLLSLRRQERITRAVTSDDHDWLPLRRDISLLTSGSRGWAIYEADFGSRFVRIADLPRGGLSLRSESAKFVDVPLGVEGSRTRLNAGDLVFSITAYLGSVCVVGAADAGAFVSQHVALCRLTGRRWIPEFVGWFCLGDEGQRQLNEQAYGGTKQQLALDDIRELRLPVIDQTEQRAIVEGLAEATAGVDALVGECRDLITLLKERRAALITAAVTGQIEVG